MSWFLRGVQSAIFHYASCAPCTGYSDGRKRRRAAKLARKAKDKLQLENPEAYHHPEPTGTNPFWEEEIRMGPGPPPRRNRRTNTNCSRGITTAETQSSVMSKTGSSVDVDPASDQRLSDDTLEDTNWNHKRYQREDEDLWGIDDPFPPLHHVQSGSSAGVSGWPGQRPGTARSGSFYSVRAPPVNDLHPPVVSLPSPNPADSRWMLQPPPKASVMAGKERATNRSRSGSGASSRIEVNLQRKLSSRQVKQKLERGETPELASLSRNSSRNNLIAGPRRERSRTPQARPPSANSSRRRKRHDTVIARSNTEGSYTSLGEIWPSSEAMTKSRSAPHHSGEPDVKIIKIRQSRPALSTVVSSNSREQEVASHGGSDEHAVGEKQTRGYLRRDFTFASTPSRRATSFLGGRRAPLSSSDISSLNCLQDLVSPRDLLKSRFVSAPLVEAKIRLPPSDLEEAHSLGQKQSWTGKGFTKLNGSFPDQDKEAIRVPFDSRGLSARDPRMRWSVDF